MPDPQQQAKTTQPTGKATQAAKVKALLATDVTAKLVEMGFEKEMLQKDLDAELAKVNSSGGYGQFKPLVLGLDETIKKLYAAVNYKPGATTWDVQLHPEELLAAAGILVDVLAKKNPDVMKKVWDHFPKALSSRFPKPLAPAASLSEDGKKQAEKFGELQRGAWVTLLVSVLKAWSYFEHLRIAFGGASAGDVRKLSKSEAVVELFKALEDLAGAVYAIASTRKKGSFKFKVDGWSAAAGKMRDSEDAADDALALRVEKMLGTPAAKAAESKKKREEAAASRKLGGAGLEKMKKVQAFIKGVGALIGATLDTVDAWNEMHPEDLDGRAFRVEGLDAHAEWTLSLKKKDATTFTGTLTAKGLVQGREGERAHHASSIAEEAKATVTITRFGATDLRLVWKGAGLKDAKIRTAGDAFYAATGELTETAKLESTLRFGGELAIGAGGGKKTLVFARKPGLGDWLNLAGTALQVLGALWAVLPKEWRRELTEKALDLFGPRIAWLKQKVWSRAFAVREGLKFDLSWDTKAKKWKLELGVDVKKVQVRCEWNFVELVDYVAEHIVAWFEKREPPPVKRPAIVPESCSISVDLQPDFGIVTVSFEAWEGKAKDPKAGKSLEQLKTLWAVGDAAEWLESFCGKHDFVVDIGTPKVKSGNLGTGADRNELPGLEETLTFYVEKVRLGFSEATTIEFPLKISLSVTFTMKTLLAKLPQVRAVLFAWDVGWTIGTLLSTTEPVQVVVDHAGGWYLNWAAQVEWKDKYFALDRVLEQQQQKGAISMAEALVGQIKAPHYLAAAYNKDHWLSDKLGHGAVPEFRLLQDYRARLVKRVRAAIDNPASCDPHMQSPGLGMTMALLMGADAFHADEVERQLDKDVQEKVLLPIRADFLRFYLHPEQYEARRQQFVAKWQKHHEQLMPQWQQYQDGKAVSVEVLESERTFRLVNLKEVHRDVVQCVGYRMPEPGWADAIEVRRFAQGGWGWEIVRRRANEPLEIQVHAKTGFFSVTPVQPDPRKALLSGCDFHYLRDTFDKIAPELLKHSASVDARRVVTVRLTVRGEDGDAMETKSPWTLWLDGQGKVLDAHPA